MNTQHTKLSIAGKMVDVDSLDIDNAIIVVTGNFIRIAEIKGDHWALETESRNHEKIVDELKKSDLKADLYCFSQKLPDIEPRYQYPMEWDNLAVITIDTFEKWWKNQIPQVTRKNVRRSTKRGLTIRKTDFDSELVKGIVSIYNETPIRQGRRFWHYGKEFERVREENSTYLDRSDFIGAYFGEELVGYIKLVYMGQAASMMAVICKNSHRDKRPANALIAKAVEICAEKKVKYLIYSRYIYPGHSESSLVEFKKRNGFKMVMIPRYYVPLTLKGRLALKMNLHNGIRAALPNILIRNVRRLRAKWYARETRNKGF